MKNIVSDSVRRLLEEDARLRRAIGENDVSAQLRKATGVSQTGIANLHIAKLLQADEAWRRQLASLHAAESLEASLLHGMQAQVTDLQRLGLLDTMSDAQRAFADIARANERYKRMFEHPNDAMLESLSHSAFDTSSLSRSLFTEVGATASIKAAMRQMESAWLKTDYAIASSRALGELVAIGRGVSTQPPFDVTLVTGLRGALGDWRDPISISSDWTDPVARTGFYRERGFDESLTDFPQAAFAEALEIAGFVEEAREEIDVADGDVRAQQAYARLRRLEIALRAFMEEKMAAAFGPKWLRQQVPVSKVDEWKHRRDQAVAAGHAEQALIDYADFTDYVDIIVRKDNWDTVFRAVFQRPENFREGMQRLYPIRVATMHARSITSDDELYLKSETVRIFRAIAARSNAAKGS